MKMNKKLLALSLCLVLIFSPLAVPAGATSTTPVYSITVDGISFSSTENKSGDGWIYEASKVALTLSGYNGSSIKASGDLVIYAEDDVTVSGKKTEVYSSDSCGIVVNGTLTLNTSGKTVISGTDSTTGKGGEGIVAAKAIINSNYGSDFTVKGASGAFAIKANELELGTKNLTALGGSNSPAIFFSSSFEVLEGTSADVISGSNDTYAITHLIGATYNFDEDVTVSFFDNSSRVIFESKSGFLYGDILIDGDINTADVILLAQYIAGWGIDLSDKALAASDVAKDGTLNTKDVVKLAQFIAEWDVVLGE